MAGQQSNVNKSDFPILVYLYIDIGSTFSVTDYAYVSEFKFFPFLSFGRFPSLLNWILVTMLHAVFKMGETFVSSSNVGNRSTGQTDFHRAISNLKRYLKTKLQSLINDQFFVKTTVLPFQPLASGTVHQQETMQIVFLKAVF